MKRKLVCIVLSLPLLLFLVWGTWTTPKVWAQEKPFYKGKTVRIIVCCTPGGFYDRWARLFARYLGRYIPGNPDFIVQNMPGAGSLIATNYVYKVAKPDGLTIVMPLGQIYLDQFIGTKQVRFDIRKFHWIGTQEKSHMVLYMRADAPYKTVEDILKAKERPKCGSSGTASAGHIVPKVLEEGLGAKFKIVSGYPGGSEIDVAVERGEVICRGMTIPPHFGREPFITWHKRGFDRHIIQTGRKRDSRAPDTPTIYELMDQYKTPEVNRRIVSVLTGSGELGRPFAVAPGVPPDRVRILRAAYAKALKDPQLLAEAKKGKMDVDPTPGKEVQALVNRVMNQPPEVVERVKKIMGR
ncbi:MAG: Bug family tripartite tricarboxylate transporter substrate binding protein [Candidatus Binatia bacterium]